MLPNRDYEIPRFTVSSDTTSTRHSRSIYKRRERASKFQRLIRKGRSVELYLERVVCHIFSVRILFFAPSEAVFNLGNGQLNDVTYCVVGK